VKVVEGSEIYNFPVDHIVHFYSNFGRKSRSNMGTPSKLRPRARSRAHPLRRRPPPRAYRAPAPPTSASEPPACLSRSPRAFPAQLALSPLRAHAEGAWNAVLPYGSMGCIAVRPPSPGSRVPEVSSARPLVSRGLFVSYLNGHCPLRTMCGSRTGGWSLPCVMSD
jgi:hypothetical protein